MPAEGYEKLILHDIGPLNGNFNLHLNENLQI